LIIDRDAGAFERSRSPTASRGKAGMIFVMFLLAMVISICRAWRAASDSSSRRR